MPKLNIIAQYAMDAYYRDFKADSQFFDIDDFIFHVGNTVTDLYLQEYRIEKARIRQEKSDEVVSFSSDWIPHVEVIFENKNGEISATLPKSVMAFPFNSDTVGVQDIIATSPRGAKLERGSISELWSYAYLPDSDRIYWWVEQNNIFAFKKGSANLQKAKVFYIPVMDGDSEVPDGVINYVILTTVTNMRQMETGVVIDKTNDGNSNKVLQSEINKNSLR